MPHIKFPRQIFKIPLILLFEEGKYKSSLNRKKKKGLLLEKMLFFFVSADNGLTQKEVGPSMRKDRKLLDTMLAILHEEFHLLNE